MSLWAGLSRRDTTGVSAYAALRHTAEIPFDPPMAPDGANRGLFISSAYGV